jgi:hypothetical protein
MALILALAACSTLENKSSSPSSSPVSKQAAMGAYHEFEDVLIPKDMDLNEKSSFVIQTVNFKSGILTYTGRVDPISLSNFFEANMAQDNWKQRSKMRYQTRTLLVFEKPDRDCIINIEDKTFNTQMEVIVAQRLSNGETRSSSQGFKTSPAGSGKAPAQQSPFEENLAK